MTKGSDNYKWAPPRSAGEPLRRRIARAAKGIAIVFVASAAVAGGVMVLPDSPPAHICLIVAIVAAAAMAFDRWVR